MAGEVTFQMTAADMTAAGRSQFVGGLLKRKSLVTHFLMLGVLFGVGFAVPPGCGCGGIDERLYGGTTLAAYLATVAAALYLYIYLSQPRRSVRLHRSQTSLHAPITIAWSDEALTVGSKHGTLTYPWRDLAGWGEYASAVAVKYGSYYYYFVPRRVLRGEQATDLIATLAEHGPPRL